jgi:REP-associated tyrosine transposase
MIYEYGNYYHLINRGCNKELIFRDRIDYLEFIKRMKMSDHKSFVKLIAWCLMPNHYHFLVQQTSNKPVSRWLGYVFNGYVQYFNFKYKRAGTLFQGKINPKLITDNSYLFRVISYIHLNPVQAKLVNDPIYWEYSNYSDWIGETRSDLTSYGFIDEFYESGADYKKYLQEVQEEKLFQQNFTEIELK